MCGIIGVIEDSSFNEKKFEKAVSLLFHRGPDSQKVKYWNHVKFGFARLAIQDLSEAGNQPMTLVGTPFHIVFNGEIYNYKVLRNELEKLGEKFITGTDTEVILCAYKAWGIESTLEKLEGMFAFALYDEKMQIVILARDRFGQKPLFYSHMGKFIFASEIKAILEYSGIRRLNLANSINPVFLTGLTPKNETMFDGVHQLESGEFLKYSLNTRCFTKHKYFQLSDWVDGCTYNAIDKMSSKEVLDIYSEALKESLKYHVISDAPLGSLFSAGLDSALVTAIATMFSKEKLRLYYFESENQLNDIKYAKAFANRFRGDLICNKGNDDNYIFELPKMVYHYETINKEEGTILGSLCRKARQDGYKALLTGDASDEIFGGQSFHCSFYTQSIYYHNPLAQKLKKFLNRFAAHSFFNYLGENPAETHYLNFPPGIRYLNSLLDYTLYRGERLPDWNKCLEAYSFIKKRPERDARAYILDEIGYRLQRFLIRSDRFGMMESMEIRTPFLHPSLVKLAVNTPVRWLIHLKRPLCLMFEKKHLIRELAKKFKVPNEIIYRKKLATPYNNRWVKKTVENWPLINLSEHLRIKPDLLKQMAMDSKGIAPERSQYSFLSAEILIRLFIKNEKYENISEQIRGTLNNLKN